MRHPARNPFSIAMLSLATIVAAGCPKPAQPLQPAPPWAPIERFRNDDGPQYIEGLILGSGDGYEGSQGTAGALALEIQYRGEVVDANTQPAMGNAAQIARAKALISAKRSECPECDFVPVKVIGNYDSEGKFFFNQLEICLNTVRGAEYKVVRFIN